MLKTLFDKYNSDKGSKHHYHLVYDNDFKELKNKKINLLEIGILGGSSLKTWLEFFPYANIYAIDIVSAESVDILTDSRITYLQHDSTSPDLSNEIKKWGVEFDIVIEDGLHTPIANQKTFKNVWPFVKRDGVYYIEDFFPLHIMKDIDFNNKCGRYLQKNKHVWNIENVNSFLSFLKTYNVETFDLRDKNGFQDSYIIKILKS